MNELEKFRTRWIRWLGQKTRVDRDTWTDLLDSNWHGWADTVLEEHDLPNTGTIKEIFTRAIRNADMSDLHKLDELYCQEKIWK